MRHTRLAALGAATVMTATVALPLTPTVALADTEPQVSPTVSAAEKAKRRAEYVRKRKAERKRQRALRIKKLRLQIVRYAKSKRRAGQYVAGASSAWAFDCSGFTKHVYWHVARINLPHYSGAQLNLRRGVRVPKRRLLPGDLLAWGSNGSQHVSIYIGRGRMIGANNPSRDVVVESINNAYWAPRYAGARRVLL